LSTAKETGIQAGAKIVNGDRSGVTAVKTNQPPIAKAIDDPNPVKLKRRKARKKPKPSFAGIVIEPQIITGLLMMVGAVVWFGLGLFAGYIFFYPPVMFVLGFIAIIRGLTGGD
jgi:hypothetical protein